MIRKISLLLFLVFTQQSVARMSPQQLCKVPFSPSTRTEPIYSKRDNKFKGNCYIYGDRGRAICHMPNEAHKSLSRLKRKNKHDSLFLKTQRTTGISWKLIKSFVYQETGLMEKAMRIDRITSGDGLGVGYMQLTAGAMKEEIKFYDIYFKSIYSINISEISVKRIKLHHMILGVSWLLHKFKTRTRWSKSKLISYFKNIYFTYKDKGDGWGFKQVENDVFIRRKLKEAVTAYNGLSSKCIVGGRVLTAYGDHVEHYYYSLIRDSDMPMPYVASGNETEELSIDNPESTSNTNSRAVKHNYSSNGEEEAILEDSDSQTGYSIGIGVSI